jgi:hypothetical protein
MEFKMPGEITQFQRDWRLGAVARLEANAAAIHAEAAERRGFQAVSSMEGFSALIRHGKTVIEISGDDFAVRQTD